MCVVAMKLKSTSGAILPPKRYLTRDEAAMWLGVSVDTFKALEIPHVNLGPRSHRWDIVDIETFAEQNKSCDSARTSASQKGRQICVSTNATIRPIGGRHGTARMAEGDVRALGLKIKTLPGQ